MHKAGVEPGEFPFPLIEGPEESRYLTWVRNHSNYMAERGFLDYMRILAVLVRGILINFLTILPWLLLFALVIGAVYKPLLTEWDASGQPIFGSDAASWGWAQGIQDFLGTSPPFLFTPWVGLLVLLWFLLFPAVTRLFKVATHTRSLKTGSGSSVKLRDKYERSFDGALLLVAGTAAVEATPLLVYYFHQLAGMELRELVAGVAGTASVIALSAAGKLISVLEKVKRALVMWLIGLLGLALPMLVVLYVVEELVYGGQVLDLGWQALLIVPVTIVVGLLAAIALGAVKKALKYGGWLTGYLVVALALTAAIVVFREHLPRDPWFFVLALAVEIWAFCWLTVDINLTSVHGLYRDRLASAYLVGEDVVGDVDIEEDLDLHEIAEYEAGSIAPYHLVNVALNLQASKRMEVRERNSEFFIFSKRFVGGRFTGYCRSERMESVFPQMDLATAMAISAAAASPNMGAFTSAPLVAVMTLFNVRLGYWVPNPGVLERKIENKEKPTTFEEVFPHELDDLLARWENVDYAAGERALAQGTDGKPLEMPTPEHGLVGIGLSGGGIRSATINLGIAQALDARGVFRHADYLSTVSGGGYLGSSLSTLMRRRHALWSLLRKELRRELGTGPFMQVLGMLRSESEDEQQLVLLAPNAACRDQVEKEFRAKLVETMRKYESKAELIVKVEDPPRELPPGPQLAIEPGTLRDRFNWRVRPTAFLREILGKLHERHRWVNLSDGGHIENLATIELLRRRCKFIITGDGEGDPQMHFGGLATLVRYARIDLGIRIKISLADLRLDDRSLSRSSFALGRIHYPNEKEHGYLLYLKSAYLGSEDEVIQEYRNRNPLFPHESTADQSFDEGQFEAYRALGQSIGENALKHAPAGSDVLSYAAMGAWFDAIEEFQGRPGLDEQLVQ